ncbi:unnamed protein product, partial [Meganyctiphanes norvegica]
MVVGLVGRGCVVAQRKPPALPPLTYLLMLLHVLAATSNAQGGGAVQAPRFVGSQSSTESVVNEGHTKILQCQALGYPQPEYHWLKDGDPLGEFSGEHFFKISSVSRSDAGDYRCLVRNSAGSIFSAKITVKVAYMSGLNTSEEQELRVQSGSATLLTLPPLESYPAPSVTWQADDSTLLYGIKYATTDPDNQLVILAVQPSDAKTYRARITNTQLGVEEISGAVHVVVEGGQIGSQDEVPPLIIVPPNNQTIIRGTSIAQLQCIANASPLHQLETLWFKDNIPIEQSGVVFSFNGLWNRTLSLLQGELHYAGTYRCQVRLRTSIDEPIIAEAVVTVHDRPQIKTPLPLETLADLGKTLTIPCNIVGSPAPHIQWYRDGHNVANLEGARYRKLLNGSLAIGAVHLNDTGMFQCLASNEAGETSTYTWLKVKTSAPQMIRPPENATVLDGQDATIPCRAGGAPHPNVTWLFNDVEELVETGHYQILESGDLLIAGVRTTDEGKYSCQRANDAGKVEGHAWLSILVKTQISQPPVDTRTILGHVATLQCKVSHAGTVQVQEIWF